MRIFQFLIGLFVLLSISSCRKNGSELEVDRVPYQLSLPPSGSVSGTIVIKELLYLYPITHYNVQTKLSHLPAGMSYTIDEQTNDANETTIKFTLIASNVAPGAYPIKVYAYGNNRLFTEDIFTIYVVDYSITNDGLRFDAVDLISTAPLNTGSAAHFEYGFKIMKDTFSSNPEACVFSRIMSISTINDQFHDVKATINHTTGDIRIQSSLTSPYQLDSAIGKLSFHNGAYQGIINYWYLDKIWQGHYEGKITFQ